MQRHTKTTGFLNLEEEIALIKQKLSLLHLQGEDSALDLSKISEKPDDFYGISLFASGILDNKNFEGFEKNSSMQEREKPQIGEDDFGQKLLENSELLLKLERANKEILDLQGKICMYEAELEYCIEENNHAFDEINDLRSLLLRKDEVIRKLYIKDPVPACKNTYKAYSGQELLVNPM